MLQTTGVEKIKTHFMFNIFFFVKIVPVYEIMSKYGRNRLATDDNIMLVEKMWLDAGQLRQDYKQTNKQTNKHATQYFILTACPLQQSLRACTSVLQYTYIACFLQ
jgi:hypothetical protein